jgi:hypothetical protein
MRSLLPSLSAAVLLFSLTARAQAPDAPPAPAAPPAPPAAAPAAAAPAPAAPAPATTAPAPSEAPPPAAPAPSYPRVGGHVGVAIPLVTFADPITGIGADYAKIGLAPGITVKLSDRWAVDFEFVAYSNFFKGQPQTTFVVDPGLVYNFGPFAAGLRAAIIVNDRPNLGFIPIILKGFPISERVNLFVELDLPVFFSDTGPALTIQPQAGVSF